MNAIYAKGVSPQGLKVYSLLLTKGALTINDIAATLHMYPHAVYRLAHYLSYIGLIKKLSRRPVMLRADPVREARENYLAYQRSQFDAVFSHIPVHKPLQASKDYQISFIQGREEIFARVAEDLRHARKEAKFIVLGLPIGVTPELMLEQRNAVLRGVPVRIIVQEYTEGNRETLRSWKSQGLDVRHGHPIGFHLLLIDGDISYLMYYDPEDKTRRYAVRIVHEAINRQLQIVFDIQWKLTKPLPKRL